MHGGRDYRGAWLSVLALGGGCGPASDPRDFSSPEVLCEEYGNGAASVTIHETLASSGQRLTWMVFANAEGEPLMELADKGSDGDYDQKRIYVRDASGRVLREEIDENADGRADHVLTNAYDDEGRRLSSSIDLGTDGTVDEIYEWDYSVPGRELRTFDNDADGTVDDIYTVYYEGGEIVRAESDRDADGALDSVSTHTYGEDGELLEHSQDTDGDGDLDQVTTFEYGADSQLVLRRDHHEHFGGFGADSLTSYEYDADGFLIGSVRVYENGPLQYTESIAIDERGRPLRIESRDHEGILNFVRQIKYGEDDHPIADWTDLDADGVWDSSWRTTPCGAS